MTALLVVLGAAVGAPLRHLWSVALDDRWTVGRVTAPVGTLLVNSVGSALAGVFAALSLSDHTWALAVTGFCGSLTSFSSFVVQAVDRGPRLGGAYAAVTAVASIGLCALGFALGTVL